MLPSDSKMNLSWYAGGRGRWWQWWYGGWWRWRSDCDQAWETPRIHTSSSSSRWLVTTPGITFCFCSSSGGEMPGPAAVNWPKHQHLFFQVFSMSCFPCSRSAFSRLHIGPKCQNRPWWLPATRQCSPPSSPPPPTRHAAISASVTISVANRLIGEVVQSRTSPLLGPSPGWKRLLALSHLRHY